jgi:hypothetical protein
VKDMAGIDPAAVKVMSEKRVIALGGEICDWLPWLDRTEPRDPEGIISRALVMHAMLQIYFGAPIPVIARWLSSNGLLPALSRHDRLILAKSREALEEQERIDLFWNIEALWALVWVGGLIPAIPVDQPVGDALAGFLPNLQLNEGPTVFSRRFRLRPFPEVFAELDFYFRAHWYARNGSLRNTPTGLFNHDVIMERRKALEWACDRTIEDWDECPDGT